MNDENDDECETNVKKTANRLGVLLIYSRTNMSVLEPKSCHLREVLIFC